MNIGCVVYKKNFEDGSLDADWRFESQNETNFGTGKAMGNPGNNYAGKYKITYFNSHGVATGVYNLIITEEKETYKLQWFNEDRLKYSGIGMRNGEYLIASWKKITEKEKSRV